MDQRNGARPRIYYSAGQSSNRAQMWGWFDLFILIILVTLVVTLVH
jgi:hypothetical protein